jgi:hypothetical protein
VQLGLGGLSLSVQADGDVLIARERTIRILAVVAMVLALTTSDSLAQPTNSAADSASAPWSYSLFAYTYIVPNDDDYVQPTFTADRDWLHIEARYDYEDFETGSVWLGYNFGGGEEIAWTITPMLGGVFGETDGVAPGFDGSLGWRNLEFTSQGEHVFDADDAADSFFYSWSELTMAATDAFSFGLAMQRTQVYETANEFQGGVLVGFSFKSADVAAYVFDPYEDDPVYVFAAGVSF